MISTIYSVIKYMPDIFRKEFLNVGVFVCIPKLNKIIFRTWYHQNKLKSLDPNFNPDIINNFEEILNSYIQNEEFNFFDYDTENFKTMSIFSEEFLHDLQRTHQGSTIQFSELFWSDIDTDELNAEDIENYVNDLLEKFVKPIPRNSGLFRYPREQSLYIALKSELRSKKYLSSSESEPRKVISRFRLKCISEY